MVSKIVLSVWILAIVGLAMEFEDEKKQYVWTSNCYPNKRGATYACHAEFGEKYEATEKNKSCDLDNYTDRSKFQCYK